MASPRNALRRMQARRSTWLAIVGAALVALGIVLTVTQVVGDVVPTVLAVLGLVLFVIGSAIGTRMVFDNFRFRRDQSYYDDE